MKLEVSEFYLSAAGEVIKIESKTDSAYPFMGTNSKTYLENGIYEENYQSDYDLIAHIPKELHFDIIRTIKAYHSDNSTKEYIDCAYNNKG